MTSGPRSSGPSTTHAVLVFPDQHLDADEQIAFRGGSAPIEVLFEGYDAVPISTVDGTGEVMAPDQPVMQVVRGNQGWHTDSSYMPVSAKASVLSARVVPADGGETEWADMRAAYDALDDATRERIAGLGAFHSIVYSQTKAGFDSTFGYGMDRAEPAASAGEGPPGDRPPGAVHRPARARHPRPRTDESDALLAAVARRRLPAATRRTAIAGSRVTSSCGTTAACCTARVSGT